MPGKRSVLIVDDSAVARAGLTHLLNSDPRLNVIAVASDAFMAASKIQQQVPDVIVLDLKMPRMDGLTFLKRVMAQHPMPIVICSHVAEKGSALAEKAMAAGAVDVLSKPKIGAELVRHQHNEAFCDAVVAASHAKLQARSKFVLSPKLTADVIVPRVAFRPPTSPQHTAAFPAFIAIGASTGGTEALTTLLTALTPECAGILVVQHMPAGFTANFAHRLNELCEIEVREASNGDAIHRGLALIAPGNFHLLVNRKGSGFAVEIKAGPAVCRHCPSVDVLFRCAAQSAGQNAIGVILTGMGDDGARGMLEMKQAGAFTIAQDRDSCVVFGMPNEAIKMGGVAQVAPLDKIAPLLNRLSTTTARIEKSNAHG